MFPVTVQTAVNHGFCLSHTGNDESIRNVTDFLLRHWELWIRKGGCHVCIIRCNKTENWRSV